MKYVEIELLLTFIGSVLGLIAVVNHLTGNLYPGLLYVSMFCLFGAKWIELAERIYIDEPAD